MGLADQLFAGLGQGLATGVQNYNQGLEQQQQMAMRKQEAERQMQMFAMQKQQHDFDQGYKRNALVQHDMQGALARGDNQAAAGYIGDLNTARQGMGLAALSPVVGSPVASTPAQAATPIGPTPTGQPMGLAARPAVAPHNDFSNPQTFNALASAADYVAPEPKLQSFAKGALVAHWDPKQHKMVQDFQVPEEEKPYTLGEGQVRVDPKTGIVTRGPAKSFAPQHQAPLQRTTVLGTDGQMHMATFNPNTGAYQQDDAVAGAQGPRTDKNTRVDAKTAKENWAVVSTKADPLIKQFPGVSVSSAGVRPLGDPTDSGATIVDGHQTQWGLWNNAMRIYGSADKAAKYVAYPGTSKHGNGMSLDVVVPLPQQPAFEKAAAAAGFHVYDEGNSALGSHWHLDYVGAMPGKQTAATVLNYDPSGKTATVVPKVPGTVVNTRPTAAKAPRPFNANAYETQWRNENGIPAGVPLSTNKRAEMVKATQRAKTQWNAEQNGTPDAAQQLVDMMKADRAARGIK